MHEGNTMKLAANLLKISRLFALFRCVVLASLFFLVQQARAGSITADGNGFTWVTDQTYSGVGAGTYIYFYRGSFDEIDLLYDLKSEAWYNSNPSYTPDTAIGTAFGAALNAEGASFWSGLHPYSAAAENPRLMFGVHKYSSGDHVIANMSSTINSNHTWDVVGNDIGPYKSTSRTEREDQGRNNIDDRGYWWASTAQEEATVLNTSEIWTLEADVGGLSAGTRIGFEEGSFNTVNAEYDLLNQPWYIENPGPNEDDSLSLALRAALGAGEVYGGWASENPHSSAGDNPKFMFATTLYDEIDSVYFQPVTYTGNNNAHGDWSLYDNGNNYELNDASGALDATFGIDLNTGDRNVYYWAVDAGATTVPDTGSTAALLGLGVAALAFARRRLG